MTTQHAKRSTCTSSTRMIYQVITTIDTYNVTCKTCTLSYFSFRNMFAFCLFEVFYYCCQYCYFFVLGMSSRVQYCCTHRGNIFRASGGEPTLPQNSRAGTAATACCPARKRAAAFRLSAQRAVPFDPVAQGRFFFVCLFALCCSSQDSLRPHKLRHGIILRLSYNSSTNIDINSKPTLFQGVTASQLLLYVLLKRFWMNGTACFVQPSASPLSPEVRGHGAFRCLWGRRGLGLLVLIIACVVCMHRAVVRGDDFL